MLIGEIFALATAFLWAFTSILFTEATNKIGTLMLNFLRLALASILIFLTLIIVEDIVFPNNYQLLMLSISGIIGLIIGDTFLFKSYTVNGPRISSLIMSINPAVGAIAAYYIFNEDLSLWAIGGMLLTIIGISIVTLSKKEQSNLIFKPNKIGYFYAFIAALCQAFGLIFVRFAMNDSAISPLTSSFIRNSVATLLFIPILILFNKWKNPINTLKNDSRTLKSLFIGTIIGPYLGITLSLYAVAYTKIGIASAIMSFTPILLLPLSVIFYKEKLSKSSILGAVIAVLGVGLLFLFN